MLIQCPECKLQVSDKALSCPHCGYPLHAEPATTPKKPRAKSKHRRLPNGFGQISEIKNRNLRKPFRVMITVGKDENGKPICKPLKPNTYFETYNDAYAALVEYNRNPYDLKSDMTMAELYDKWTDNYFETTSASTTTLVKTAWAYCGSIANMRVADVRARHIRGCMDEGVAIFRGEEHHPTATMKEKIKMVFNLMLDYAVEYELVDRNYARTFHLSATDMKEAKTVKQEHIPFTDEEMEILWSRVDDVPFVDIILIQCYSGWRPQEMGLIRLEDADLEHGFIRGGIKTSAGKNRIVPIHSRIRRLVERKYKEAQELGSQYLFNFVSPWAKTKQFNLSYDRFKILFKKVRDDLHLSPEHRPHDGRKHFVTMAKRYGVDEYAIKHIVGHQIADITEKTYTQRDPDWLKTEIEKIK